MDIDGVVRAQHQLSANGIEILGDIVGLGARTDARVFTSTETIALARRAGDAECGILTDLIVVAGIESDGSRSLPTVTLAVVWRRLSGAWVMTLIRPAEVFLPTPCLADPSVLDAIKLVEIAEADTGACAVDTVDDDTHRRLETRIVANRADTANARAVVCASLLVLVTLRPVTTICRFRYRGPRPSSIAGAPRVHRDRHVLQLLFAPVQ
ncbi:hypothetical protein [Dokdonella sp.]|uniref:hypothetical protein n=1 Tax=Dokdonella sp. TaxID=2291710 RepID=UPI0035280A19